MKVLQIGMGNNPGGVEAFVMNYYRQLSLKGIRFDFVSMYGEIAFHQEILSLGGQVFLVPNVKKDYFGYVKALKEILAEGFVEHSSSRKAERKLKWQSDLPDAP